MTINEQARSSNVFLFSEGDALNSIRDTVTIASGTVASAIGQVLAKVTATGKYTQVTPAAVDGSQTATGVLVEAFTATLAADTPLVALVRGPAAVKNSGLAWTTGMTALQIATASVQLTAAGIKVQTVA